MKFITFFIAFIFTTVAALCQQPIPQATTDTAAPRKALPAAPRRLAYNDIIKMREHKSDSVRFARSRFVTNRMADSLALSPAQRESILSINTNLEQQKAQVFKTDTIRANISRELQQIEKQRDIMYRTVLSEKQFQQYEKSKINLLNPQAKNSAKQ